jgi:very-short-patch-repair endonuclease
LRGKKLQGVKFRRQHAIDHYIVDFCAIKEKLVIELDGIPFGRSTLNKKITMQSEPSAWNGWDLKSFASGTIK